MSAELREKRELQYPLTNLLILAEVARRKNGLSLL